VNGREGFGPRGVLLVAASIAVLAAIVAGLWAAGPPSDARARSLDERRVRDLQWIASAIDFHVRDYGHLPASLADLTDSSRWTLTLTDPETKAPYGYRPLTADSYELCATYALGMEKSDDVPRDRRWVHPAGRYCHQLTPERLPHALPSEPVPPIRGD
jgi:hypothetical protein